MKYSLVIFSVFFLMLNSAYAVTTIKEKQPENSAEAIKKNSPRKNNKRIKQNNWPATFVPSEKINADSSVAFPVDI